MSENGSKPDYIKSVHLKYFTAFEDISIEFSPGINFIIGENGTGKTHLLKVMYAVFQFNERIALGDLFYKFLGQYFATNRHENSKGGWKLINFHASPDEIDYRTAHISLQTVTGTFRTELNEVADAYGGVGSTPLVDSQRALLIPAKELLSHNRGFIASIEKRYLSFEKHYYDILINTAVSPLRRHSEWQLKLLHNIERFIGGQVIEKNEEFYISTDHGPLEFTLVAEGHRKLALYWLLLNNGMLDEGTILFIDEPEANLNPKLMDFMSDLLLELSRHGVQVFVASHSYVMLKHFEQKSKDTDQVRYHVLYRDDNETRPIRCQSVDDPLLLEHDPILDAYNELYDRDMKTISEKIRSK